MEKQKNGIEVCKTSGNRKNRSGFASRWLSFRRFRDSTDGVAAIEFALLALPFLAIVIAILETSISYFVGRSLEISVDSVSRQLRTGEIGIGTTEAEFRALLCSTGTMAFFDCQNSAKMLVDVRTVNNFQSPDDPPLNPDGSLDNTGFGFNPGGKSTITIVRVYYQWDTILQWSNLGAGGKNNNLLMGSAAFLTEP